MDRTIGKVWCSHHGEFREKTYATGSFTLTVLTIVALLHSISFRCKTVAVFLEQIREKKSHYYDANRSRFPMPFVRLKNKHNYLYYYRRRVCVFAKFDQFLPVRSHFDTKRPVNLFHVATFQSATFGRPLFAFVLCVLRQKIIKRTKNARKAYRSA